MLFSLLGHPKKIVGLGSKGIFKFELVGRKKL